MLLQILFDTIPFINEPQIAAIPALAALAIGSTAVKAGTGLYQTIKGGRMKAPQSDFQTPALYKDRMARLRSQEALAGKIPGQDLMENKFGAATAQGITAMKEAGNQANFQDMIAQSVQSQQDQLADLGIKAAARKDRFADAVTQGMKEGEQYDVMGQERKFEKEAATLAEKQALKGSGIQNLTGAATDVAQMGMQGAFDKK
jgi:hypothetical protein